MDARYPQGDRRQGLLHSDIRYGAIKEHPFPALPQGYFDKHNLKIPETIDELYTVSKQLKELYPDSYPFCMRSGLSNINVIGPSRKPYFHYNAYYDFVNEKWCYGAAESETIADYSTSLSTFVSENIQKFILGQRPLSEWDKFREELSELQIAELLAVYEEAYNRIK